MLTLSSDIYFPCTVTWKDPTLRDPVGAGAYASRRRWARPLAHFKLALPADELAEAQRIFAFYSLVRGDQSFWFDGGTHGAIKSPQTYWLTDGVKTQYQLPFGNILAPTWKIYVNDVLVTNWTAIESSGVFVFATPPAAGEGAAMGERMFKVQFWGDDDMFSQTEFFDELFDEGIELREIP